MDANTHMVEDKITIRAMAPSDAKAAAELSKELGYPLPMDAMEARLREFAGLKNHIVYAACLNDQVVGWIDVGLVNHLLSGPAGEIGGLIVSSQHRGYGIGKKLVAEAEEWIAGRGLRTLLVRSRISREAAHNFYLRQNFSRIKTQAVFQKSLDRVRTVAADV